MLCLICQYLYLFSSYIFYSTYRYTFFTASIMVYKKIVHKLQRNNKILKTLVLHLSTGIYFINFKVCSFSFIHTISLLHFGNETHTHTHKKCLTVPIYIMLYVILYMHYHNHLSYLKHFPNVKNCNATIIILEFEMLKLILEFIQSHQDYIKFGNEVTNLLYML